MKIGLLTLPLWNNYGGIIQAYALQNILKANGHEVVLLNYHHNINKIDRFRNNFKRFVKYKVLKIADNAYYPNISENKLISENTLKFISNEFDDITPKLFTEKDLKINTKLLDAVIVGSDQVWRPNYTPNIYNYFLQFLSNDKLKIAYAASLGTDKWLFDVKEEKKCKELIHQFKSVSVREDSSINLLKEKFDFVSSQVLDPTLLLNKEDYIHLLVKYPSVTNNKNKIFTYILDETKTTNTIINQVSIDLGKEVFSVMPKKFDVNFNKNKSEYIFPELTEWIKAFNEADYVIADSFHGCVFAIIFNKPFIAIGNKERGLARFISLLKLFKLEHRLLLDTNSYSSNLLDDKIDWYNVNEQKKQYQQQSLEFLLTSLKND